VRSDRAAQLRDGLMRAGFTRRPRITTVAIREQIVALMSGSPSQ
jgi:hypothetical protein